MHQPKTPTPLHPLAPSPFFGAKNFFFYVKSEKTKGREAGSRQKKRGRTWCPPNKFFNVLFSPTQLFLLDFSWSSNNITASNRKNTSVIYQCVWDNYVILSKNVIISLLCQYGLLIQRCVSKNVNISRYPIFYLHL